jgi:hypothetical protein
MVKKKKFDNLMRRSFNKKDWCINILFTILRNLFGGERFFNLSKIISYEIIEIKKKINRKIYLLDYGCGKMDFTFFLKKKNVIKKAICVDDYKLDQKINKYNWLKYINLSFNKVKFEDSQFDVSILIDVLHHIGIDKCGPILEKIYKSSKFVIIKDHFEYSYFSRQILRLADWHGNYGTSIKIPKKYFNEKKWQLILKKYKLKQIKLIKNVKQHTGLFSIILPPKHHFISILKNYS